MGLEGGKKERNVPKVQLVPRGISEIREANASSPCPIDLQPLSPTLSPLPPLSSGHFTPASLLAASIRSLSGVPSLHQLWLPSQSGPESPSQRQSSAWSNSTTQAFLYPNTLSSPSSHTHIHMHMYTPHSPFVAHLHQPLYLFIFLLFPSPVMHLHS